jgi:hypothetical protein
MERNELSAEKRRGNDSSSFHNDSFDCCGEFSGVFIWPSFVLVQDTDWSDCYGRLPIPVTSLEGKAAASSGLKTAHYRPVVVGHPQTHN